jgi:hypothetical protein
MRKTSSSELPYVIAATLALSAPAGAATANVGEALALMKQIHTDECQQKQLRGRILVAHQSHDEETLSELGPQLETINARLKPSEDKLNALTAAIKNNPEDRSAFEAAQLETESCD